MPVCLTHTCDKDRDIEGDTVLAADTDTNSKRGSASDKKMQTSIELIDVVAAAHLILSAQEQILGDVNLGRVCLIQLI